MWKAKSLFVSLLLGLLLAGPLAALALVALPEHWRGPTVPWAVAALSIALVALVRHSSPRSG